MGGIVNSVMGLIGMRPPTPAAPILKAPTVMPTADDERIRAAKRKTTAKQVQRGGRQSTILSGDGSVGSSDTLG